MSYVEIASLDASGAALQIISRPSNDIQFATDMNGVALARSYTASYYSNYETKHGHMQTIFMQMMKQQHEYQYPLEGRLFTMFAEGPVTAVRFRTDDKDVDVTVLKTADNLIGIQTYNKNWQEFRESIPPVWLGQCDLDSGASRLLDILYSNCHDDLLKAWEPKGCARKEMIALSDVSKPKALKR